MGEKRTSSAIRSTGCSEIHCVDNRDNDIAQAPFGGEVTRAIGQHNRASPYVANAGLLHKGGLEDAQMLGFKPIVDLRGADERGVSKEAKLTHKLGIRYLNTPVANRAPG